MIKFTLEEATEACKENTRNALQIVYDSLNRGQQKKLLKNEKVKALFDLYGLSIEQEGD